MIQSIAQFILFRCLGWKVETTVPARDKCILCVAPHTSNWDFLLGETFSQAIGRKAGFLMKKEWFFWPLGCLFRALGGIPVVRSRHQSLTDQLADIAIRSRVTTWKRGFYYIALKANIPIQLFAIDAKHKRIVCTEEIMPSGDVDADMKRIMDYYRPFADCAFYPEKFALEEI